MGLDPRYTSPVLGVLSSQNVSLVDLPFGELGNTFNDLLNKVALYAGQVPVTIAPIPARPADAADVVLYGPDVDPATDLIVDIKLDAALLNAAFAKKVGVVGYWITQRFQNNQVSPSYTLSVRHYMNEGPSPVIYTELNRDINVTPTGGANSVSEWIVWQAAPGQQLNYDATTRSIPDATPQRTSFISVFDMAQQDSPVNAELGLIRATALIFKDQQGTSQQLTVTPLFAHEQTIGLLTEMINSLT